MGRNLVHEKKLNTKLIRLQTGGAGAVHGANYVFSPGGPGAEKKAQRPRKNVRVIAPGKKKMTSGGGRSTFHVETDLTVST